MHARPDARRHSRLRSPRRKRERAALVPFRPGSRLLPTVDGGRNQPREPAHAVGAAAGDAGGPGVDCRPISSAAAAISCAGDAKPARAGGHLSSAGSPARPLPVADRCRLPRPRRRAADADCDDRNPRGPAAAGDEHRRADGGAAPRAPHSGRRERCRGDPFARPFRQTGRDGDRGGPALRVVGAGTPRQPGPDARLPGSGIDRRPVQPLDRRCSCFGAAGTAAPHGGQLCRPRGRRHSGSGDRADFGAAPLSLTQTLAGAGLSSGRSTASPAALRDRAEQAAAVLPPLLVAAERVAVTVAQGVHGRRRVGQGETFWQFRQYEPGDAATRIDWRESAKSQRLYVRETEWEAAQSVWLWRDASSSMDYSSAGYIGGGDWPTSRCRGALILVALASLLVRGGERLTLLGSGIAPISGRVALSRLAQLIERPADRELAGRAPACEPRPRAGQLVLIGDFLAPLEMISAAVTQFAGAGLKGHLLQIADPA